jgi:hypothetical protein
MGHAFGIFMAHGGALHSLRSFRRRLPWALGQHNRGIPFVNSSICEQRLHRFR